MKKNILFTGPPSAGKTTVIKKIVAGLQRPANGFYTLEERVEGRRVGFMMHTLDGKQGYLGHQNIESEYHIRRFGVSIENIQNIAIPSIQPLDEQVIILDEIAKMECFCEDFITAATAALDSDNQLFGTIAYGNTGFIAEVKARGDVEVIEVTQENRNELPHLILQSM